MKIQPSELERSGFVMQDSVHHQELIPFVQTWLKKRTFYSVLYIAFNVLALALTGMAFGYNAGVEGTAFGTGFSHFSYGIALAFLLIPLHEYIHVLAYRSQGAVKTSYGVNWKKFYFIAIADQFVANSKEFQIVALAPFAIISTLLLILFFVVSPAWQFTLLGMFFTHTACCSGDFGLLSYFSFHKNREVVTYDDAAKQVSFFFVKMRQWTESLTFVIVCRLSAA